MDYKKLNEHELSALMVSLISRTHKLYDEVNDYNSRRINGRTIRDAIQVEYKEIKSELREIAHYDHIARDSVLTIVNAARLKQFLNFKGH